MPVTMVTTHRAMSSGSAPTMLLPVQAVDTAGGGPIAVVKGGVATRLLGEAFVCVCVCIRVCLLWMQVYVHSWISGLLCVRMSAVLYLCFFPADFSAE